MKNFKILISILLICAMIISVVGCTKPIVEVEVQPPVAAVETPEPVIEPTSEPTEEPTPTPSSEPTPEPTPTVMKDRGTDFDKDAFFSLYWISESELNAYIEEGHDAPEWYVEEDDVFENRYGFDIDYDGTDDYKQDWNADGNLNCEDKGFYWYCDDDNDGIMNVFDRDWAGFEWLPFGEGVLPAKQEDVQHLAPDAESKYAKYEKLITDSYITAYKEVAHLRIENYEGSTISFDPFGDYVTSRTASGHFGIETILQERCVRATNGMPLDNHIIRLQYSPIYGSNADMNQIEIDNYGCKVDDIDQIDDLYTWFCENAIPTGGSSRNCRESYQTTMTDFRSPLYSYFTAKQFSEMVNLRVYTSIFDRDGQTYITLALMYFPFDDYDPFWQRIQFDLSRLPYGTRCAICQEPGIQYFTNDGTVYKSNYSAISTNGFSLIHFQCRPNR